MTWDPTALANSSTLFLELKYVDSGEIAWSSEKIPSSKGYTSVKMEEQWRQGQRRSNLTFYAFESVAGSKTASVPTFPGPMVSLTTVEGRLNRIYASGSASGSGSGLASTPTSAKRDDKTGLSTRKKIVLAVGLSTGLVFLVFTIIAIILARRQGKLQGFQLWGLNGSGYATRKSMAQRTGLKPSDDPVLQHEPTKSDAH